MIPLITSDDLPNLIKAYKMSYSRLTVYASIRLPSRGNFPGHGLCIGKVRVDRKALVRAISEDNLGHIISIGKRGIIYHPNQYDTNLIYDVEHVENKHEFLELNEAINDNEGLGTEMTKYILSSSDDRVVIVDEEFID